MVEVAIHSLTPLPSLPRGLPASVLPDLKKISHVNYHPHHIGIKCYHHHYWCMCSVLRKTVSVLNNHLATLAGIFLLPRKGRIWKSKKMRLRPGGFFSIFSA